VYICNPRNGCGFFSVAVTPTWTATPSVLRSIVSDQFHRQVLPAATRLHFLASAERLRLSGRSNRRRTLQKTCFSLFMGPFYGRGCREQNQRLQLHHTPDLFEVFLFPLIERPLIVVVIAIRLWRRSWRRRCSGGRGTRSR
jgi:hypothetical protein